MMKTFWGLRLWLTGLVLLVISVAGATWLLNSGPGDGPTPPPPKRPGLNPRSSDPVTCVGYGDVEDKVIPLTPIQPGRVEKVLVKEYETVKAGQILLKLDHRKAEYAVQQAEGEVKAAKLELENAQTLPKKHALEIEEYKQAIKAAEHKLKAAQSKASGVRELVKKELAKPREAEQAEEEVKAGQSLCQAQQAKLKELELVDPEIQIKRAQADVAIKEAVLNQAKYALSECDLRAPVDGLVLRILIGPGELVAASPQQPAIQLAPCQPRIIRAEVEQEFADRVKLGQPALVEDDSHAEVRWTGKVIRISDWYTPRRSIIQEPLRFNDVRTLECVVQLDPGQKEPRIGQRVRVTIGDSK
jgi:multidrug resistance efflux pump